MNLRLIAEIGGALVVVGLALAYHAAKVDAARSDAVQQAQGAVQKQLSGQLSDLKKEMADRDAHYQQDIQSLQIRLQQSVTPAQVSQLAAQVMGLKQPIQIVTPAPTPTNPNPQPVAQVSVEDTPQVKAYISECETCKLQLPKLQADNEDFKRQLALKDNQILSVTAQREAAIKASKGGNWVRRFAKAAEYFVIGGAVGYVAAKH